jgi:enoyl reductase-like protein
VTINGEHEGKLSENRKQISDNEITDRAKKTINALNLNCDRLVDARQEVIRKLKEASEKTLYGLGDNASYEQIKQSQIELAKQFLFDKDGKPAEFFTTIRAFFKPLAENILSQQPQDWI